MVAHDITRSVYVRSDCRTVIDYWNWGYPVYKDICVPIYATVVDRTDTTLTPVEVATLTALPAASYVVTTKVDLGNTVPPNAHVYCDLVQGTATAAPVVDRAQVLVPGLHTEPGDSGVGGVSVSGAAALPLHAVVSLDGATDLRVVCTNDSTGGGVDVTAITMTALPATSVDRSH
jgi:hypothetical protein